jgi:hypothetical protein
MDQWNAQYRPAPQFEQEQLGEPPAAEQPLAPDLEAMALTLDQMKVEAAIDAERTRPSLNGLFALVLVGGVAFIGEYVARYGSDSLAVLTSGKTGLDPEMLLYAGGAGVVVAALVALISILATRRTRKRVRTFEHELVSLGGTPFPERGQPLPRRKHHER